LGAGKEEEEEFEVGIVRILGVGDLP